MPESLSHDVVRMANIVRQSQRVPQLMCGGPEAVFDEFKPGRVAFSRFERCATGDRRGVEYQLLLLGISRGAEFVAQDPRRHDRQAAVCRYVRAAADRPSPLD